MKRLPEFQIYMVGKAKNYGTNSLQFFTSEGVFWFSYETLVAFKKHGSEIVCRQNDWGPTTGKHLNAIEPDKSKRVTADEFVAAYQEAFKDV